MIDRRQSGSVASSRRTTTALLVVALLAGAFAAVGGGAAAASTDDNRRFVAHVTRDLVGHHPGPQQEEVWTGWLDEGWPRLELTRRHIDHPVWNGRIAAELFTSVLGRPIDSGGAWYWTSRLLADVTPDAMAVALATSPESLARGGGTAEGTVAVLYRALLGRAPDRSGLDHHVAVLSSGGKPVSVAVALRGSAEARGARVDAQYVRLLGRPADPAGRAHWLAQLAVVDERELAAQLAASAEYFRRALDARELPPITEPIIGPAGSVIPGTSTTSTSTTSSSTAPTTTTAPSSTTTQPEQPAPEHFTGSVADFYVVPAPLRFGAPGTLIRYQDVSATADWVTLRIMYHSRDAENRDRAVTGIITYPTGTAPAGGWPVVSFSHGTTGIASQCAPSRDGRGAPLYGVHGVGVATDYIGLGPVGEVHPYLSASAEGHAAIDAVRAARQVQGANASAEWLSIGLSQGAHASLIAGERNATYAPELTLLGTVAMAPPAAFDQTFGALDEVVTHIIGVMMLFGMVEERPDVDPYEYVSDEVAAAAHVLEEQCLPGIQTEFLLKNHATFWKQDPREVEPTRSYVRENEPGLIETPAPMYVSSGTADIQVPIGRVHVLMDNLCDVGQVVEYHEFAGADHGAVFARSDARVREFLAERIAGDQPTNSCPWR